MDQKKIPKLVLDLYFMHVTLDYLVKTNKSILMSLIFDLVVKKLF